VFFVFGREQKKLRNRPGKEQKPRKVVSSPSLKVPRAFYNLGVFFKAAALQGPPPLKDIRSGWFWHP